MNIRLETAISVAVLFSFDSMATKTVFVSKKNNLYFFFLDEMNQKCTSSFVPLIKVKFLLSILAIFAFENYMNKRVLKHIFLKPIKIKIITLVSINTSPITIGAGIGIVFRTKNKKLI